MQDGPSSIGMHDNDVENIMPLLLRGLRQAMCATIIAHDTVGNRDVRVSVSPLT